MNTNSHYIFLGDLVKVPCRHCSERLEVHFCRKLEKNYLRAFFAHKCEYHEDFFCWRDELLCSEPSVTYEQRLIRFLKLPKKDNPRRLVAYEDVIRRMRRRRKHAQKSFNFWTHVLSYCHTNQALLLANASASLYEQLVRGMTCNPIVRHYWRDRFLALLSTNTFGIDSSETLLFEDYIQLKNHQSYNPILTIMKMKSHEWKTSFDYGQIKNVDSMRLAICAQIKHPNPDDLAISTYNACKAGKLSASYFSGPSPGQYGIDVEINLRSNLCRKRTTFYFTKAQRQENKKRRKFDTQVEVSHLTAEFWQLIQPFLRSVTNPINNHCAFLA